MGFENGFGEHFGQTNAEKFNIGETPLSTLAEQSIVNTIMEAGSGQEHMSDACLRFVRYLLSISRPARFGFLPNFADLDTVHEVARQFIRYCGSAAIAIYTMNQVLEGEAVS